MNELQKALDDAYSALAAIPVSGDLVEVMAAAREHLRRAYKLAAPETKEGEADGRQDNRRTSEHT